jgi:hypothetical protein
MPSNRSTHLGGIARLSVGDSSEALLVAVDILLIK